MSTVPGLLAWRAGAILGGLSVVLGAFGAHGLQARMARVPDGARRLDNWKTAAQYQAIHSLALLALSAKQHQLRSFNNTATYLFVSGIAGFSGSLYLMTLDTERKYTAMLGPITPLGGMTLIGGWVALALLGPPNLAYSLNIRNAATKMYFLEAVVAILALVPSVYSLAVPGSTATATFNAGGLSGAVLFQASGDGPKAATRIHAKITGLKAGPGGESSFMWAVYNNAVSGAACDNSNDMWDKSNIDLATTNCTTDDNLFSTQCRTGDIGHKFGLIPLAGKKSGIDHTFTLDQVVGKSVIISDFNNKPLACAVIQSDGPIQTVPSNVPKVPKNESPTATKSKKSPSPKPEPTSF
ncbi:hypothetical protein SeLEV6574_g04256 [Synchytrium endobioticum]|uniref:Superoxide dismutase copper/zinc binding domain-containing protein n=1 Tax=Synchytrium endobioticum TaxID=286115 RepID=A0A507D0B7_9FUNG|nr:hypothetical protein SeLEV6574_g04256 [Synchytrium endobioticum]